MNTHGPAPLKPPPLRLIWLAILVVFMAGMTSPAQAGDKTGAAGLFARAEPIYAARGNIQKAIQAAKLYHEVLALDPDFEEAALRLVRLYVWIGVNSADAAVEMAYYKKASKVAEEVVKRHPGHPGPHYWLGVAYGVTADLAGPFEGLSLVGAIKEHMSILLKMDPRYSHGGPYRILGRLYHKLPALVGGNNKKAEHYLRKSIEAGPGYLLNYLYLAAVLQDEGKVKESRQLVAQVKARPLLPGWKPECVFWKKVADDILLHGEVRMFKTRAKTQAADMHQGG